jgi:hypothetical protein
MNAAAACCGAPYAEPGCLYGPSVALGAQNNDGCGGREGYIGQAGYGGQQNYAGQGGYSYIGREGYGGQAIGGEAASRFDTNGRAPATADTEGGHTHAPAAAGAPAAAHPLPANMEPALLRSEPRILNTESALGPEPRDMNMESGLVSMKSESGDLDMAWALGPERMPLGGPELASAGHASLAKVGVPGSREAVAAAAAPGFAGAAGAATVAAAARTEAEADAVATTTSGPVAAACPCLPASLGQGVAGPTLGGDSAGIGADGVGDGVGGGAAARRAAGAAATGTAGVDGVSPLAHGIAGDGAADDIFAGCWGERSLGSAGYTAGEGRLPDAPDLQPLDYTVGGDRLPGYDKGGASG